MVDGLALSALVSAVTKAAASEAGKSVWLGLVDLGRRLLGRTPATENALQNAREGNEGAVDLAAQLFEAAIQDPHRQAAVREWMAEAAASEQGGTVVNFNNRGTVGVQAGHISGGTVYLGTGAGPRG